VCVLKLIQPTHFLFLKDEELLELLPILYSLLSVSDVRSVLSLRSLKQGDRDAAEAEGGESLLFDYKE
jgi:hypothetical protein